MQKRVNAMEHPAYNTLTLQEKLQMPEVRWTIVKAIAATIAVSLTSLCFAVVSVWIMLAVPIWYREYDELYADSWKDNVRCNAVENGKFVERVILECKDVQFDNIAPSLQKTFERTLAEFVTENPHSKYVLVDLLKCHNSGRCKFTLMWLIGAFIENRIWVLISSWVPTVWGILLLIQRCMMPYWNKVWFQLTRESAREVKWGAMKQEEQDKELRDIVTPPIPAFPSDHWTQAPAGLDLAGAETTSEEDDLSSVSSVRESKTQNYRKALLTKRFHARDGSESNAAGGRMSDLLH